MDISSVALLDAVTTVAPQQPAVSTAAPDSSAVAQFQSLMTPASVAVEPVAGASGVIASAPAGSLSLGDRILAGLDKVGTSLQSSMHEIDATMNTTHTLGAADMLKVQRSFANHTLGMALLAEGMGGVTNGINKLVNLQ